MPIGEELGDGQNFILLHLPKAILIERLKAHQAGTLPVPLDFPAYLVRDEVRFCHVNMKRLLRFSPPVQPLDSPLVRYGDRELHRDVLESALIAAREELRQGSLAQGLPSEEPRPMPLEKAPQKLSLAPGLTDR